MTTKKKGFRPYKPIDQDSKWVRAAKRMPPCYKTQPGEPYSIYHDETFICLSRQPDILAMAFARMQSSGAIVCRYDESGAIVCRYDEDGNPYWIGVEEDD